MSNRRTAVFVLREESRSVARVLSESLPAAIVKPDAFIAGPKEHFREQFRDFDAWVLLMSAGIAVRFIDGLPEDKHTDPAVVVLDEGCHHAISLLSGHEGGANQLAFQVANATGATPVVSTATESTKRLVLGIGCRKGVSTEQVKQAVSTALGDRTLADVRCLATITAKAQEPALLQFCADNNLPLRIFEHDAVAARAWVTEPSAWVRANLGLDGVCEPCALMATPRGQLVVPKTAVNGVTVAIVEDAWRPVK